MFYSQESEALELYNKALQYQHSGECSKAEETYELLLTSTLVTEVHDEKHVKQLNSQSNNQPNKLTNEQTSTNNKMNEKNSENSKMNE